MPVHLMRERDFTRIEVILCGPWIVLKKRDGYELSREEIERFIQEYTQGSIADYQAAAWCMAIFCGA